MALNPKHVKHIIEALAQACGESLDMHGYHAMSDYILDKTEIIVTHRYLYDTYKRTSIEIEEGKNTTRTYLDKMDLIAITLGYGDFSSYIKTFTTIDPILESCIGNWWSLVRANSGSYILKAPIRIFKSDDGLSITVEMKGGRQLFTGTAVLKMNNMFCALEGEKDKKLFVVMKLGGEGTPEMIQGTFAGISSAGDPIAGREIFLRENQLSFDEMAWQRLSIEIKNGLDKRINAYYKMYEMNCIKITNVSSFSLSDID